MGPDKLIYFMSDDRMGGLFEYDFNKQTEQRLLHKQNLSYQHIAYSEISDQLLFAQQYQNGISNIGISDKDGRNDKELTGGDTVDSAPCWVQDTPNQILFQSSGIARGEHGDVIAYGPSAIMMLDVSTQEITSIMERDDTDFLSPKVDVNGNLFFIRRPYARPDYSYNNALIDILVMPFRLLRNYPIT